ncbi:MAG: acyl-CoA synthetase [Halobacteriales archaeon]
MQPNVPQDYLPDEAARPDIVRALPELHYPPDVNITETFLDEHVESGHGDAVALYFEDDRLTYADLLEQVERFGRALAELGIEPGDRVVLRFPNRPEGVVAALAVQRLGAIIVPTMRLLRADELAFICNNVEASAAVVSDDLLGEWEAALPDLETVEETVVVQRHGVQHDHRDYDGLLEDAAGGLDAHPTAGDDIAVIFYTSGTTGRPKGAVHTHHERLAVADAYGRYCLEPRRADVFGGNAPLPFSYGYGAYVTIPFRFGAAASLIEDAEPVDMLRAVEAHGITVIVSVPTAYNQLLTQHPEGPEAYDTSSLRLGMSAGEPLAPSTFEAFESAYGVELLDGIGTSEMGHIFLSHRLTDEVDPSATGYPAPGYECKVVDRDTGEELPRGEPGLLAVRGPAGITYWNRPDEQAAAVEDGWNYPGDVFVHREDGRFEYQSRADDIIISAGYKIPAPEVENALLEHDAVLEVGVAASPDPERNEIAKAFVVPAPDAEPGPDLVEELQDHVKRTLAPYKYPRAVEFVDGLPRTETGKIRRTELREREQEAAQ